MPCSSIATRRKDKAGKVIGLALDCSGECAPGLACDQVFRIDPTNGQRVIELCACRTEVMQPGGSQTIEGYVTGPCRIALLRQHLPRPARLGSGAPLDVVCVGICPNSEKL